MAKGRLAAASLVSGPKRSAGFGGLQLGRVGREELQHDAVRPDEPVPDVPAGLIPNRDDQLVLAGADRLGEGGQHRAEQVGIDRGADEPDHRPGAVLGWTRPSRESHS